VIERKRHIAKAITWRFLGTLDTVAIGWFVSGDLAIGASIGILELVTKTLLYYAHERVWYRSSYGVEKK